MLGWLRVIWRFFFFIGCTGWAILSFATQVVTGTPKKKAGVRVRRAWINQISSIMGLKLEKVGEPAPPPVLYVSNHITYIDPIAILLYLDADIVAKAEVRKWPLVGYGAHMVGTIFVQRDMKSSRHETASAIRQVLDENGSILVFPEGTTTAGPGTLPFKPRSFNAAHLANVPVQPIAIWYDDPQVAFIGNDTFIPHFFRIFRMKKISGRIAFGPLLYGDNTAEQAEQWINDVQLKDHP